LRKRRPGVEENSTATQILRETGNGSSIEVNGQWQMHFETLSAAAFQTIGIGAHIRILFREDLNSIVYRGGREVPIWSPLAGVKICR
jgi:hypothetical protein